MCQCLGEFGSWFDSCIFEVKFTSYGKIHWSLVKLAVLTLVYSKSNPLVVDTSTSHLWNSFFDSCIFEAKSTSNGQIHWSPVKLVVFTLVCSKPNPQVCEKSSQVICRTRSFAFCIFKQNSQVVEKSSSILYSRAKTIGCGKIHWSPIELSVFVVAIFLIMVLLLV